MIAYLRGTLDGAADRREVPIRTTRGLIVARAYASLGDLAAGDDVIAASAVVAVGVVNRDETALLGAWSPDRPDPGGPLGLASTPVILLPDATTTGVALAGVARAGRASAEPLAAATPGLGLDLLAVTGAGAEAVVITGATGRHVDLVRILGGRAIVALPRADWQTIAAWLGDAELAAELPVPITDRDASVRIASLGLEDSHQLVQVDPTPALEEAGVARGAAFAVSAAAAAGVLAGRIAAGNRRWRADADG